MTGSSFGPSVFIYVQHLLGVGHLSRALALSQGLIAAGSPVTLVSGGFPAPNLSRDPKLRWVQLPPVRARDATFTLLEDEAGQPIDDAWREGRRRALLAAYAAAKPQVLITELYPFGRRMMAFELLLLLTVAKDAATPPLIVSSVRDILATPKPERMAATCDLVRRYYDLVLVHGDPAVIPLLGLGEQGAGGLRPWMGGMRVDAGCHGAHWRSRRSNSGETQGGDPRRPGMLPTPMRSDPPRPSRGPCRGRTFCEPNHHP